MYLPILESILRVLFFFSRSPTFILNVLHLTHSTDFFFICAGQSKLFQIRTIIVNYRQLSFEDGTKRSIFVAQAVTHLNFNSVIKLKYFPKKRGLWSCCARKNVERNLKEHGNKWWHSENCVQNIFCKDVNIEKSCCFNIVYIR